MFGDAKSSRRRDLRVRTDNPAADVRGPDPSLHVKRRKSYLYPTEFLQLLSSEDVPVRWARIYALAIYTYGRAGEQAALTCEDVDLQARKIELLKQLDAKTGELRETKESAKYAIPIEPNLLPLLEQLIREAGGMGPLLHADRAAGQVPTFACAHPGTRPPGRTGLEPPKIATRRPLRRPTDGRRSSASCRCVSTPCPARGPGMPLG
jgi:integrase